MSWRRLVCNGSARNPHKCCASLRAQDYLSFLSSRGCVTNGDDRQTEERFSWTSWALLQVIRSRYPNFKNLIGMRATLFASPVDSWSKSEARRHVESCCRRDSFGCSCTVAQCLVNVHSMPPWSHMIVKTHRQSTTLRPQSTFRHLQ